MQTAVRKRAADFDFWGDTPTPEFCENSHERGPRSPAGTAQGFDPPLGAHQSAAGTARAVCAGVKRAAAHWRRCASAGAARAVFAGAARAKRSAGRRGGRFRGAGSRSLPSGRRREAGRGRDWPREAHKGRVAGTAARGGHVAGRRGAGGFRGFPGRKRGRRGGRRARGSKAEAAARCRGTAGGGAGKTAAPSAACVGFQATSAIETAGGRKSPFLPYKEALFSGRSSCQIRAVLRPNPCRFGRVAFSAAQSDECVTPGGAGEKPRRKTKRPSERSEPHEKPDFRYRD